LAISSTHMNEPISSAESLRDILSDAADTASRFIWDVDNCVCKADLFSGTWIDGGHDLSGKSVLIGGLKVYPEEIESLLNLHPVRMSCVRALKNPITGSLVVAEVVLNNPGESTSHHASQIKTEILQICRDSLPRHKVPATINFVPALSVASSGKVARRRDA
jgi:acyl-CoA synthetase (AMP-forming)/AMP-acid ligase II